MKCTIIGEGGEVYDNSKHQRQQHWEEILMQGYCSRCGHTLAKVPERNVDEMHEAHKLMEDELVEELNKQDGKSHNNN